MRHSLLLSRDNRGAAVVEVALVAPFLAVFLIGMVQLANGYSAKLQLEQIAQREVESWQNSSAGFDTTQTSTYQSETAAAAGVASSAVIIDYWLECNNTRQASFTTTCSSGQSYSRYASVSIAKAYNPMFSTKWAGANSDGSYTLHAKALLRFQ